MEDLHMAKKGTKLGVAVVAGAGAAAFVVNKKRKSGKPAGKDGKADGRKRERKYTEVDSDYRNTELGKNCKNSKGIYYSNGNYEAFARPEMPEGVEEKNA